MVFVDTAKVEEVIEVILVWVLMLEVHVLTNI